MARNFMNWFWGDIPEGEEQTQAMYGSPEPEPAPAPGEPAPPPARSGLFRPRPGREDVVELPTSGRPTTLIEYPTSFDDAQGLADQFKAGALLILDLEKVDEKDRPRLVHFLCGVTYGCNGKSHRINELTFAFAPRQFDMDSAGTRPGLSSAFDLPRYTLPE
jgi:cell division inhibitor SepF